jgi:hypothetical protein
MLGLRNVLRLDAAASGGLGALLLVLVGPAEDNLGLPVAMSVTAGVLLLAWAGFVALVARNPARSLVREVIGVNLLYVAASAVFAWVDRVDLTGLGVAVVLVQAVAVLCLTAMQIACARLDQPRRDDLDAVAA